MTGSSPLARGLHDDTASTPGNIRIIPARAGFTGGNICGPLERRDHPRSRGVYRGRALRSRPTRGSSPLARGLLRAHHGRHAVHRIIPARAGFTDGAQAILTTNEDHPRSRGVYRAPDSFARSSAGSSPLARGLHTRQCVVDDFCRIIPARAGFTSARFRKASPSSDHPRSRGVYALNKFTPQRNEGSSPLARGLRSRILGRLRSFRITPARAGFTSRTWTKAPATTDHPRSRGVYRGSMRAISPRVGSSPLARGLP